MSWKFDKEVAKVFPAHARAHIPNYDQVLEQCLELCLVYGYDSTIVDVGVATGETIIKLSNAGFKNLYGVDNSQDMLDACPQGLATLINSDNFPLFIKFDVVLINWTLHFIRDKKNYLKRVYEALNSGGALFITEKVSNADLTNKFYYNFKRANGVSEAEIEEKARSLEGVMFVDSIDWYMNAFKELGFKQVYVVNAFWSFASFLCIKD